MSAVNQWCDQVTSIVEGIETLAPNLRGQVIVPPGDDDPAGNLTALLALLDRLSVDESVPNAAAERGERLRNAWDQSATAVAGFMTQIVHGARGEVARLLGEHGPHPRLILSADFGGELYTHEVPQSTGGRAIFMLGPVHRLAADHPARTWLTEDELFRVHGKTPVLVLGLAQTHLVRDPVLSGMNAQPRPFYRAESVKALTRKWRQGQKQKEMEDDRKRRYEEEARRAAASPEGQKAALLEQITELQFRLKNLEDGARFS